MQSSAADGQVRPVLPPPPQSPVQSHTPPASPSLQAGLQQEISFASPLLQQPAAQGQEVCPVESAQPSPQQQPAPATTQTQLQQLQHSKDGSQLSQQDLSLGRKHTLAAAGLPRLHLDASTDLSGDALLTGAAATDKGAGGRHSGEDDQVLFDADLASYISETDYTDLRCEDFEVGGPLVRAHKEACSK
jgi:hypothetical protein